MIPILLAASAATTPANTLTFTTPFAVTAPGSLTLLAVGCGINSITANLDVECTVGTGNPLPIVHEAGDRTDTGGQGRRVTVFELRDAAPDPDYVASIRFAGNPQSAGWTLTVLEVAGVDLSDPYAAPWDTVYLRTATEVSLDVAAASVVLCGTRSDNTPDPIGEPFATVIKNSTNQHWTGALQDAPDVAGLTFAAGDAASRVVGTACPLRAGSDGPGVGHPVMVRQGGVFVPGALRVRSAGAFVTPTSVTVI